MASASASDSLISLIPGGALQFVDLALDLNAAGRPRLYFREQKRAGDGAADGEARYDLFCLTLDDQTQETRDRTTGQAGDYHYEVDGQKAVELFLDRWLPLPMLRVRPGRWPDGGPRFDRGPGNWARIRIVRDESGTTGVTHRAVLAFDPTVEPPPEGEVHHALTPEQISANAQFALAHHERDSGWFLNLGWVDEWLKEAFDDYWLQRRRGRRPGDDDGRVHDYLAHYLTFLETLRRTGALPTVQVVDQTPHVPIDVDLVLDIGNSRTCGLLVESRPQAPTDLNDGYVLALRDLSQPQHLYVEPFETRVEFADVASMAFGNARLSERSGRTTPAFAWPTNVRVGREAARLARRSVSADGSTGMSSPKRYLWDERPRAQQWRYNGVSADGIREPPVTSGVYVQHVNMEGTPLEQLGKPLVRRNPVLRRQSTEVAFEARFTRSALMMFMLSEIVMHALAQINSPAQRRARGNAGIARRLRRVIFTVPTAMPLAEQRIYRRWAEWSIDMLWRALDWHERFHVDPLRRRAAAAPPPDFRQNPEIRCDWDEATCAQLVYLYNELAEKFHGDTEHFFRLLGRPRDGAEPALRVASIDIGGGTTDLSIIGYEMTGDPGTARRIKPTLLFRDGFNVAGDDILRAIIEDGLLADLRRALQRSGVADPRGLLGELLGRDVAGQSQATRARRAQFARHVAIPAGLALLSAYETGDPRHAGAVVTRRLGDLLGERRPAPEVLAYVDQAAHAAGARDFALLDAEVRVDPQAIDRTVRRVIGPILADLCEIVHLYDCDLLLLTGRPSRWPTVRAAALAKLPVPPDRVVPMSEYRVGRWYPFADYLGRIGDPKTTVVVGAILGALSSGHLEGFALEFGGVRPRSTARFVGEMGGDGQIRRDRVWVEIDVARAAEQELARSVEFSRPLQVGFRQLAPERWTTTRFYMIDFADARARANAEGRLPYKLSLRYRVAELDLDALPGREGSERDEGELTIDEIEAADGGPVRPGDIEIRLQTLPSREGYWIDTGIFTII